MRARGKLMDKTPKKWDQQMASISVCLTLVLGNTNAFV